MIVPRTRLLVLFALFYIPLIALATFISSLAWYSTVLLVLITLIVVIDAFRAVPLLEDITVQMPEVIRMSKDREGQIHSRISSHRLTRLRVGLDLPIELNPQKDIIELTVPSKDTLLTFFFTCTPAKRGSFFIKLIYLEGYSFLKLWAVRKAIDISTNIRVYPNILPEQKKLAAFFLNRGVFGIHAQRQVGKGREFEKLREYIPGDSYEDIHWKATAKRGYPITRIYQLERTQEVYVVLDASRLSSKAVQPASTPGSITTVFEYFVTSALIVGLAAEKQGDLFGLITFDKQILNFVRARNGKSHFRICRDALYTAEASNTTPDFEELASFISLHLRRRALIVFLTNIDDPLIAEEFVKTMDLIRSKHLILVNMVKPAGIKPLFSDLNVNAIDDLYEHLGHHIQWAKLWELKKVLQAKGIAFSLIEKENLSVELVSRYINVKQRQLL